MNFEFTYSFIDDHSHTPRTWLGRYSKLHNLIPLAMTLYLWHHNSIWFTQCHFIHPVSIRNTISLTLHQLILLHSHFITTAHGTLFTKITLFLHGTIFTTGTVTSLGWHHSLLFIATFPPRQPLGECQTVAQRSVYNANKTETQSWLIQGPSRYLLSSYLWLNFLSGCTYTQIYDTHTLICGRTIVTYSYHHLYLSIYISIYVSIYMERDVYMIM